MPETLASAAARPRPVVLHVDEDGAGRDRVSHVLRQAGFDVIEASTGRGALDKIRSNPDVIVLEVRLPDISGVEVCRLVKADPATSGIPVLHLSASYTSGGHIGGGLDAGADAYLIRPVEPIELVAAVNALLRQRRTEQALRASEERYRLLVERERRDAAERIESAAVSRALAEERTRLLDAERAAREEAEQANRLKDEFLATLSHELRTPLNAIVGWAMILRRTRTVDSHVADGLATIERNARVQTQLIDDLLDVSRIISGKLRLDVDQVDLAAVIEAAIDSVHPASEAREIRVERTLAPEQTTVRGDSGRLQQAVWNLLTNAIKFTPRGGRVVVTLARVSSHVEIVVADSGCGIDPAFLPHVFDRFRQADPSTTRTHGGLGLGLAIVRHLVELHGGTVEADSEGPDQGARFTIRLPLNAAGPRRRLRVRQDGAARAPGAVEMLPTPGLGGVRVLIVDDQEDSRRVLAHILEEAEASVETAASAAEAMDCLRLRRFDVIISDVGMPGRDGYELMRWVRALPAEAGGRTPALAITGFARPEDRRLALLSGFQIHLAKPVDPGELLAAVASAAGRTGTPARSAGR